MGDSGLEKSNIYAVLIGIDFYFSKPLPDGGYYHSLHGCVRDINDVESFLLQNLKVPEGNIYKLTSSKNINSDSPSEPSDKRPAYENMFNIFKKVTDVAQRGDEIYIHFSGHGGRATTGYPELKGENGLDKTLVPFDIGNSEARYLRDIELAHILMTMVDKGLVVTVVLDSCHSGEDEKHPATRAIVERPKNVAIRGISSVDTTAHPIDSLVASTEELTKTWQSIIASNKTYKTCGFEPGSGWLPQPIGYTLIAACRSEESALEAAFGAGGERNGVLTYFLLKSLKKKLAPGTTYRQIHNELITKIYTQFRHQTPMLEGEGNREVLEVTKLN